MADTPNMNLPIPTVGQNGTLGPDWGNRNNASFYAIDSHNHSSGQGVPINPDGININDDLPMNGNNLTTANSLGLNSLDAAITALLRSLQCVGGELFYVDASGNAVQITLNGSVTGSSGTITGLPSGTASASFAAGAFTFRSATNTPATMNVGPLKIGEQTASPNLVTIESPAGLAASYALTLPPAQGASASIPVNNGSGSLTFQTIGTILSSAGIGTVTTANGFINTSANTAKTITSINLTAGTWLISGTGLATGTSSTNDVRLGINTTTNSLSGLTEALNYVYMIVSGSSATYSAFPLAIPCYPVTIVSPTTYYLVTRNNDGTDVYGTITAVKVA